MLLEQLISRDGYYFDQAVEILRTNHRVVESPEQLYRFSLTFPHRLPRSFVNECALVGRADGLGADEHVEFDQQTARVSAASHALSDALTALGPQDRVILKMRFQDHLQVAQIARVLNLDQKPLYQRIKHSLKVLRRQLEQHGVGSSDIGALIASASVEFETTVSPDTTGKLAARPSIR